jgi:alpha-glucosidase
MDVTMSAVGVQRQPAGVAPWWKRGVLYQVYVRSFADSNGDGVGDLRGVIARLDHLTDLGVDGIWLSPVTVSPNADWGYDVADYCTIQPEYGTLQDFDDLVRQARRRGIEVVMDLVPNHTSDLHPWFQDARSSRNARHRDWYVWADPKPDGSPPNNWVSAFGGPAWTLDEATGQMYLHNFGCEQPDLNWWNEEVRSAFDGIQRFWLDRGVAGFRIDVCHMVVKDASLRDNPPATDDDGWIARRLGQRPVHNSNRPEVHDAIRRWRRTADAYDPPALLLGETSVHELDALARFYGNDDELHLALNVPFLAASFDADAMRAIVGATAAHLPDGAWPLWAGSNHDVPRMATRWAAGDPGPAAAAIMVLLTLRGTPILYQGDEIGLPETALAREELLDPPGQRLWPVWPGRDGARTPMPWSDQPGGGFTAPGVRPWLPFGDLAAHNVEAQRRDPESLLTLTRDLIALRHATPDLCLGMYEAVPSPPGVWAYRRGEATLVALNLQDAEVRVPGVAGTVAISTHRRREGDVLAGRLVLHPWEGVVVIQQRSGAEEPVR